MSRKEQGYTLEHKLQFGLVVAGIVIAYFLLQAAPSQIPRAQP